MNSEQMKKAERITYDFLNKIDLKPIIISCRTIDELQMYLSLKYDHSKKLPKELEGYLFDVITTHEFAMYCKDKYRLKIHEEDEECYIIDGFKESA